MGPFYKAVADQPGPQLWHSIVARQWMYKFSNYHFESFLPSIMPRTRKELEPGGFAKLPHHWL
jgi:hypothetical protein